MSNAIKWIWSNVTSKRFLIWRNIEKNWLLNAGNTIKISLCLVSLYINFNTIQRRRTILYVVQGLIEQLKTEFSLHIFSKVFWTRLKAGILALRRGEASHQINISAKYEASSHYCCIKYVVIYFVALTKVSEFYPF